jgi:hypothetical protein
VPPNVWHQAVVPAEDWVVVSFHTVPAEELIEERPDATDLSQRRYLAGAESIVPEQDLFDPVATSPAKNKALVRRYYEELWNRWDFALADVLLDETIVFRGSLGISVHGLQAFKEYMGTVRHAFP